MSHKGRMARGEKWSKLKASANFKHVEKEIAWIDSQESIVNDIKYFEDNSTPAKPKKEKR